MWIWQVTGYGPVVPNNKYRNREGFKSIEVVAQTKEEAINLAQNLLPENRRDLIEAEKFCKVRT